MPPALRFGMPRDRLDPLRAIIAQLFGNGEQGAMYIPQPQLHGQQVLYQDAAGTVPVTADGDPVGRNDDVSGNGNFATQSVSANRPLYQTDGGLHWLAFDRAGDHLVLPTGLASGPEAFFCGYAEPLDFAGQQNFFEFSSSDGLNGIRALGFNGKYTFQGGGGGGIRTSVTSPSVPKAVLTGYITGNVLYGRVNGVDIGSASVPSYAPNTGASYVGASLSSSGVMRNFASGKIGGLVQTNYVPSMRTIEQVEAYMAKLGGITL